MLSKLVNYIVVNMLLFPDPTRVVQELLVPKGQMETQDHQYDQILICM